MPKMSKKTKKTVAQVQAAERKILYPEVVAVVRSGANAVTAAEMQKIMGWTPESEWLDMITANLPDVDPDEYRYGEDYLLKDYTKEKVRCLFNSINRPFDRPTADKYAQDLLNLRWAGPNGTGRTPGGAGSTINGEAIIISKYGQVISGQHRGSGLILAEQIRTLVQKTHWLDNWPGQVVMDTLIVYGVDERDITTRTIDNVKPRTLADVFYVAGAFGDPSAGGERFHKPRNIGELRILSACLEYAVKLMWERTGARSDAFSGRKTHSEMVEFVDKHPSLKECVRLVYDLYKKDWEHLKKVYSPAYAAALLYLMGASASDGDHYYHVDRTEKDVDWEYWEKAVEFMEATTTLGLGVRTEIEAAIHTMPGPNGNQAPATAEERTAVFVKAWKYFKVGQDVRAEKIAPRVLRTADGHRKLLECPDAGGIDRGPNASDRIAKLREEQGLKGDGADNDSELNDEEVQDRVLFGTQDGAKDPLVATTPIDWDEIDVEDDEPDAPDEDDEEEMEAIQVRMRQVQADKEKADRKALINSEESDEDATEETIPASNGKSAKSGKASAVKPKQRNKLTDKERQQRTAELAALDAANDSQEEEDEFDSYAGDPVTKDLEEELEEEEATTKKSKKSQSKKSGSSSKPASKSKPGRGKSRAK